jgi:alpha-amylase
MRKVNFLFGIHCHQPVGNFEEVFEEAYKKAYLPFIKVLESHPKIKFAVHYSGILYEWFMEKHPEFMDLLQKMVKKGQVEVLTAGHYEPILTIIPDEDKLGQVKMASQFIRKNLGRAPQGMWLTDRIWEPNLAKLLPQAGIEYVTVDDFQFISAGIPSSKMLGYFITEEEGEMLKIFPINKSLRHLIPFGPPEEVIRHLKEMSSEDGSAAAVIMDDGEKFGVRSQSFDEGYLENLLSRLEENSEWIKFMTFSEYLEEHPPRGRIYLPSGNFSKNFLVKYPEANNLHKKMLSVSSRLNTLRKGMAMADGQQLQKAREELYKGQCNCGYRPGVFGGLHLNYLRHAVYSHLIKSEIEMEKFRRSGPYVELSVTDFNKDGMDEVIISNDLLNLYFNPSYGGAVFELDYKPKAFNLVNTLARREDRKLKYSLLDHFLSPDANLQKFSSAYYNGTEDFTRQPYHFMPRRKEEEVGLVLSREGEFKGNPLRLEKSVLLFAGQPVVNIEYKICNMGEEKHKFWFGTEFNFSMLAGNSSDRYYVVEDVSLEDRTLGSRGEINNAGSIKLVDEWSGFNVSLETEKPALFWRFPIETKNGYQSSVVFPSWKFSLEPKETWSVKITLRIEE